MHELLNRNGLESDGLVSCLFTTTGDLDAQFPAVAARNLGLDGVPLLCAKEIDVPGAMPRVIRVMVHYYAPVGHQPAHTYIGPAQALRSDLHAAQ
jgi:chorismate mutase